MTTTAINQVISDVPPLTYFLLKLQLTRRRAWHIIIACAITILTGGCATSYEPKPDLTSVETIGVVLPEASSETLHAEDVIQLYNLTKGEDTVKNSAVGAGVGAATGMVAYLAFACSSLPSCGFEWPAVGFVLLGLSGVAGGTLGAVAGATVDTQEQVDVAPLHLYEINKVLPALQRDYLARADLEARTLRLVRQENPTINFVPVVPDGDRYSLRPGGVYTDVNLVLSEFDVVLAGKAEDEPRLELTVHTQWTLTKYDASANLNSTWDIHAGSYESKKYPLSEWLADEGALLRSQLDEGLEESLTSAFSSLAEKRGHSFMDDSF